LKCWDSAKHQFCPKVETINTTTAMVPTKNSKKKKLRLILTDSDSDSEKDTWDFERKRSNSGSKIYKKCSDSESPKKNTRKKDLCLILIPIPKATRSYDTLILFRKFQNGMQLFSN